MLWELCFLSQSRSYLYPFICPFQYLIKHLQLLLTHQTVTSPPGPHIMADFRPAKLTLIGTNKH